MKHVLLSAQKPYYKANLHCHSVHSDGAYTPEEIKDMYKAKGYSVVAFTDHEHVVANPSLTDEGFVALTACEVAIKEFPDKSTMTCPTMRVCHLNFLAKESDNDVTPGYSVTADHFIKDFYRDRIRFEGDYDRVYSAEGINDLIRTANEKGFLVTYNHPRWSLENAAQYLGYEGLWAVEIYNTACNAMGIYEYDVNVYDDLLRAGKRLGCVAADDAHVAQDMFGGFVMINADRLDYQSVIRALERYDFYASTGPIIKELTLDGNTVAVTFEKGVYATLSTDTRRARRSAAAEPDKETTVVFDIPEGSGYFRVDVVGADGSRANSNAYFLEDFAE